MGVEVNDFPVPSSLEMTSQFSGNDFQFARKGKDRSKDSGKGGERYKGKDKRND